MKRILFTLAEGFVIYGVFLIIAIIVHFTNLIVGIFLGVFWIAAMPLFLQKMAEKV